MSSVGIPLKLLSESQGHVVTVELKSGQTYRGSLIEAEDSMNVQLRDVTVTGRDGKVSHLEQIFVRGSHVRLFIIPSMLRHAPMFRPATIAKTTPSGPPSGPSGRGGRGGFRGGRGGAGGGRGGRGGRGGFGSQGSFRGRS